MPRAPFRPPELHRKLFRGSQALRDGLLTRGQLRSSAWQRIYPDVYACATVRLTHEVRAFAATRLLLPGAVASGRSAAILWGVGLAGPDTDVECTVPRTCRAGAVAGIRLTRRALAPGEVATSQGVPVTCSRRTALDLALIRPLEDAVIALDQFIASGRIDLEDVRTAAGTARGRGCRSTRTALALADGLARSPRRPG